MKLRTKILAGYGVILALVILVGAWGVANLWRLGQASEAILRENYRSIRAADGMVEALERQDSATLISLSEGSTNGIDLFANNQVEFLQWLSRAKDNITINGEAEILANLEQNYRDYLSSVARFRSLESQSQTARSFYNQSVLPKFEAVRQGLIELRNLNQQTMEVASQQAQVTSRNAIASMIFAGSSAAVLGLIFSLILSKNLTSPLKKITEATEEVAGGNYDINIPVQSNDELGHLAKEINSMSQKLKNFHALNVNTIIAQKQRNEAIIDSISDPIIVVDDRCNIIDINPTAASLFNAKPKLAEGRHYLEVVEDRTLYNQIQATAESGESSQLNADDVLTLEKNGVEYYYRYVATPVKTEDGKRLGVVLLLQDVTKFKQIDQLKSDFVMTASHELRTPLTGMSMSIDLLLETAQQKLSEREQELLQTASEDVERLRSLVNDLLDLSKIESGRIDMERVPIKANFIIDKVISLFKVQTQEKNIQLNKKLTEELPEVNADANKITWVLTNLVANALRYAESQIEIAATKHGNSIYFSVTDDGPGIDPAYQSKIFDKFVQVKTKQDIGGSGLGLSICKEIVKAHGGIIWVDSTVGEGSKFSFTLPINTNLNQNSDKQGELTHV
ncbi:MAG: ATP-binding protein [Cyanobacteria bacterium J06636_27]